MRLLLPTTDAQQTGKWHYERGRQLYEAGKYRKAAAAFRKAIRRAPGMPIAHVGRGLSLARLNRNEKAVHSIERALILVAESGRFEDTSWLAQAAYEGARTYERLGQSYMALRLYTKAIESAGADTRPEELAEAFRQRGRTHLRLSYHARALEDLNQALELDPTKAITHLDRAATYRELAQPARAIADLRAFLASSDPQDPHRDQAEVQLADLTKGFEAP
jgi:tetratricopeptide (TPR) repeat protein